MEVPKMYSDLVKQVPPADYSRIKQMVNVRQFVDDNPTNLPFIEWLSEFVYSYWLEEQEWEMN